jgi:hypothetical protein
VWAPPAASATTCACPCDTAPGSCAIANAGHAKAQPSSQTIHVARKRCANSVVTIRFPLFSVTPEGSFHFRLR